MYGGGYYGGAYFGGGGLRGILRALGHPLRNSYRNAIRDSAMSFTTPTSYWRLNSKAAPAIADVLGLHPLTVVGTPTFSQPGAVADPAAKSMSDWDGAMLHGGMHAPWQDPAIFALSGWFRRTRTGSGIETIGVRTNDATWTDGFGVYVDNGFLYGFANKVDGSGNGALVRELVTNEYWHHFHFQGRPRQHGSDCEIQLWLNADLVGVDITTGPFIYGTADNRFLIGNDLARVAPFGGGLADVTLFSRWFNGFEITDLFRSGPIPKNQQA